MNRIVHKWRKNAAEEVRVSLDEYKGIDLLHIRVFALPVTGEGEAKPTPKGIAIRVEQFPELVRGIERVKKELGKTREEE